jgi:hypothetical protein
MIRNLYRIEAPHFVAGVETELRNGRERVVRAAPIIGWSIGMTALELVSLAIRKGWKVEGQE